MIDLRRRLSNFDKEQLLNTIKMIYKKTKTGKYITYIFCRTFIVLVYKKADDFGDIDNVAEIFPIIMRDIEVRDECFIVGSLAIGLVVCLLSIVEIYQ